MVHEVILPKLGVSVEEGTIVEWHKKEGDLIEKGEDLFLVETEKTSVEVPAEISGRMVKILHLPGETLKAGQVVALVSLPGEEIPEGQLAGLTTAVSAWESQPNPVVEMKIEASGPRPEAGPLAGDRASPSARRLMREHSLEMSDVKGTGPGGIVTAGDVQRAVESKSDFKISSTTELAGRRLTIARRLSQSGVVPVTLMADADVTALVKERSRTFTSEKQPSITMLLVPLVAKVLKQFPMMNAIYDNEKIKTVENINIGIAVDTPDGLIVPVLKNADRMSIQEIKANLESLAEKARLGTLTLSELTMGTFTITNLGMLGVERFTPVVNPPQSAILGVGEVGERAVAREGKVDIRSLMSLNLTFDHRVTDGATASRFLKSLKESIEAARSINKDD